MLNADWLLLRIEISEHGDGENEDCFDGYSRFWCKQAVLGAYWIAERVEETTVKLHLTEDIELEGFKEALSFTPDREFMAELLGRCNWEDVVRQIFPSDAAKQLSLFEGEVDE